MNSRCESQIPPLAGAQVHGPLQDSWAGASVQASAEQSARPSVSIIFITSLRDKRVKQLIPNAWREVGKDKATERALRSKPQKTFRTF